MYQKDIHRNKHLGPSSFFREGRAKARVSRIENIVNSFYFGEDGSVFEIIPLDSDGHFRKYRLVVEPEDDPRQKACKECGHIHNEIASRSYDDVKTSMYNIPALFFGHKRVLIDKEVS